MKISCKTLLGLQQAVDLMKDGAVDILQNRTRQENSEYRTYQKSHESLFEKMKLIMLEPLLSDGQEHDSTEYYKAGQDYALRGLELFDAYKVKEGK